MTNKFREGDCFRLKKCPDVTGIITSSIDTRPWGTEYYVAFDETSRGKAGIPFWAWIQEDLLEAITEASVLAPPRKLIPGEVEVEKLDVGDLVFVVEARWNNLLSAWEYVVFQYRVLAPVGKNGKVAAMKWENDVPLGKVRILHPANCPGSHFTDETAARKVRAERAKSPGGVEG